MEMQITELGKHVDAPRVNPGILLFRAWDAPIVSVYATPKGRNSDTLRPELFPLIGIPRLAMLNAALASRKASPPQRCWTNLERCITGNMLELFGESGFFLCSVGGATSEILRAYIENQGEPNPP
jgi:hypothetical protein